MMKKTFETPKIEWIMMDVQDILTLSGVEGPGRVSEKQIVDLSEYL